VKVVILMNLCGLSFMLLACAACVCCLGSIGRSRGRVWVHKGRTETEGERRRRIPQSTTFYSPTQSVSCLVFLFLWIL